MSQREKAQLDQERLKLYPKLVEALEYLSGTEYIRRKEEKALKVLAEAKKLEGKS